MGSAKYSIAAHPTEYAGVTFRSRLEARWAAFFDLCKWKWEYEPVDLKVWVPDFRVKILEGETLLVEVKPFYSIEEFAGHPAYDLYKNWPAGKSSLNNICENVALFGNHPNISNWKVNLKKEGWPPYFTNISISDIIFGISDFYKGATPKIELLWNRAGNITRWEPSK